MQLRNRLGFFTAREAAAVRQFANCISDLASSVDHNQLNLFEIFRWAAQDLSPHFGASC